MRVLGRLLSPFLALTIAFAAVHVAPTASAAPAAGDKDALAEAQVLYNEGKVAFETADYDVALEKWKKAYGMLPETEDARVIRHALVYNISEAQVRAYEVNRDPTHLRKSKVLLERYLAEHRAFYGDNEKAVQERAEVRDRLDEVTRMIDASEAAGETAPIGAGATPEDGTTTAAGTTAAEPKPIPANLSPEKRRIEEIKRDPELKKQWDKAGGGVVAGTVLLGIGVIFGAVAIWATIGWAKQKAYHDSTSDLYLYDDAARVALAATAIATGTVALGFIIPGAIILPKNLAARKRLKKPVPTARISPYGTPDGAGLAAQFHF